MSFFIASILVIFFTTNSCHGAKLVCNASNSQSVWMRNQCQERLVATHGKRCVFAKSGLSQNHTKTEIVKEACDDPSSNHGQVLTRLFLPSIQKYICFDKCGRLRPKVSVIFAILFFSKLKNILESFRSRWLSLGGKGATEIRVQFYFEYVLS